MNNFKQIGALVTIPFALAVPPIMGWLIGTWLDKQFETAPYLMYVLLIIGVVGGIRECYRIITRFGSDLEK